MTDIANKSEGQSGRRAIVMVIDGCGVGASPDAGEFGDSLKCNTLANVARESGKLKIPTLNTLGVGHLTELAGIEANPNSRGIFGKLEETSCGKDTQTGHWEMMGVVNNQPFPMYPNGFPDEVIDAFVKQTGVPGILCNKPASGTQILEELGEEHQKTGKPIVYTSGDSVFQIACHVDTIDLKEQYRMCEIARKILDGPHRVGRVIARPFNGTPGNYQRISGDRRDYAVPPPEKTLLDKLTDLEMGVFGVGKIEDIFVGQGLSHAVHTGSNKEGLEITLAAIRNEYPLKEARISNDLSDDTRLIFTNLVDTDSLYGHRRNVDGYAGALNEIDQWLKKIVGSLKPDDLLIITSDHGNDPTAPGTDHTREYVPMLAYSPSMANLSEDIGVRKGFCDVAASLADWLEVPWQGRGHSFVDKSLAHQGS